MFGRNQLQVRLTMFAIWLLQNRLRQISSLNIINIERNLYLTVFLAEQHDEVWCGAINSKYNEANF